MFVCKISFIQQTKTLHPSHKLRIHWEDINLWRPKTWPQCMVFSQLIVISSAFFEKSFMETSSPYQLIYSAIFEKVVSGYLYISLVLWTLYYLRRSILQWLKTSHQWYFFATTSMSVKNSWKEDNFFSFCWIKYINWEKKRELRAWLTPKGRKKTVLDSFIKYASK